VRAALEDAAPRRLSPHDSPGDRNGRWSDASHARRRLGRRRWPSRSDRAAPRTKHTAAPGYPPQERATDAVWLRSHTTALTA